MYYCGTPREPERKLKTIPPQEFCVDTLKRSLLQNYFPDIPYIEISHNLPKIDTSKLVHTPEYSRTPIRQMTGNKGIVQDFCNLLCDYLKKTTIRRGYKVHRFNFLTEFRMKSYLMEEEKRKDKKKKKEIVQMVYKIDIYGCKCHIQSDPKNKNVPYPHNHRSGRRIFIYPDFGILLWCASPQTHKLVLYQQSRAGLEEKKRLARELAGIKE